MDIKYLKDKAKGQIKPHIGILIICMIICYVAPTAANAIPVIGSIAACVVGPILLLGTAVIYLNLCRGVEPDIKMQFEGFSKDWVNVFLLNLVIGLFTMLWSLLLIIPGYIKNLSYSMATYILAENREMKFMDAIKASQAMMEGHKMELFKLHWSFVWWMLLFFATCGLAGFYVIPYMNAAIANFYLELKEKQPIPEITAEV